MEVGAVKQAFNNEVISMKRNLNQAKIQTIHKLTRKAKTLIEKKAPEKLKQKLKNKAESAVKEVLIIKKIKAKDIAKFIVTHSDELKNYLNTPEVNQDKACARLLLHKSLQEKYRSIRDRFFNSSIEDLLMSRLERRKIKKEAIEKQKNKKKGKVNKAVNAEGTWDVEEIANNKNSDVQNDEVDDDNKSLSSKSAQSADEADESSLVNELVDNSELEQEEIKVKELPNDNSQCDESDKYDSDSNSKDGSTVSPIIESIVTNKETFIVSDRNKKVKCVTLPKDLNKKKKDVTKNKNFNEKILKRKFNKEVDVQPVQEVKVVDPFFITTTGESYLSVAEPRQPDEVKDIHKQGNRKYRRAVMFGHVPKPKPRRDNLKQENGKFKDSSNSNNRFNNNHDSQKQINQYRNSNTNEKQESEKSEKLHPSWEAKKRKSGILPFEGKKIVFDD